MIGDEIVKLKTKTMTGKGKEVWGGATGRLVSGWGGGPRRSASPWEQAPPGCSPGCSCLTVPPDADGVPPARSGFICCCFCRGSRSAGCRGCCWGRFHILTIGLQSWQDFHFHCICYNIASVLFFCVFLLQGMWDPSSPIRDRTFPLLIGR